MIRKTQCQLVFDGLSLWMIAIGMVVLKANLVFGDQIAYETGNEQAVSDFSLDFANDPSGTLLDPSVQDRPAVNLPPYFPFHLNRGRDRLDEPKDIYFVEGGFLGGRTWSEAKQGLKSQGIESMILPAETPGSLLLILCSGTRNLYSKSCVRYLVPEDGYTIVERDAEFKELYESGTLLSPLMLPPGIFSEEVSESGSEGPKGE